MATTKKKVIAKFTAKGFHKTENGKISHKSHVLYTDEAAFTSSKGDDFTKDFLEDFYLGIVNCLNSPRIDPKSIRITFHILEK